MPFIPLSDVEPREIIPGFHGRLVHGERMTFVYWNIEKDAVLPEHSHDNEQMSMLVDGAFEMTLDGETQTLKPGIVVTIPSNVRHSGKALTPCVIVEMFSPVRTYS